MSILDTLHDLDAATHDDDCFVLAAQINVYNENIRRREGRILYTPADVRALFELLTILMRTKPIKPIAPARNAKPTPSEMVKITDITDSVDEAVRELNNGVRRT
jgi:hypothetical protein